MITRTSKILVLSSLLVLGVLVAACAPTPTPAPTPAPPTTAPAAPTKAAEPTKPPAPTATAAPSPARAATTFTIAHAVDVDTFDPAGQTTTTVANMLDYVVETLLVNDEKGKPVPHLAKSWEISKDGLTYTFKLQEGVKFHDGKPLDAAAVKANYERVLDPDVRVPIRAAYTAIDKIEVVDPTTVRFILKQPAPYLIGALAWTTVGILSPATIEKGTPGYKTVTQPVGSGPYVFKEYVKGSHLTLTRNPNYWGKPPYYDTVTFRIVPEAATRESLLLAGQVDMILHPPIADLPALQKNPAVKVLLAPSIRTLFISINTTAKYLDDPKVRQALNYAIDKEAIIKSVLFGAADPLDAPMAPALFGYCKTGPYPYDPAKAKALLKEAGVPAGTKFAFISPTGRYVGDYQASQAIAGYLKEVGIETELGTMDWPTYVATITKPQAENKTNLHFLGWAVSYLDAFQQFVQFQSSQHPPAGLATSFYKNPKVDELAAAAAKETDPQKRADLYCQASKIVWEDAPWIFLWAQRFPIVHSAKVTNISSRPEEKFYALYAEPAK